MGITSNPVLANGIAGLATSATAQATIQVGPPSREALPERCFWEAAYGKWCLSPALVGPHEMKFIIQVL